MQKLILGRVLQNDPRVILAHQPSRGLDIGAVHYVHKKLLEARQKGATILLISEDLMRSSNYQTSFMLPRQAELALLFNEVK